MFVIIVSAKRNVYCNLKLERELMRLQSSLPAAWPFQERRFRTPVLQWHRRQPFRSERDIQSLLNSPNLDKRHHYEKSNVVLIYVLLSVQLVKKIQFFSQPLITGLARGSVGWEAGPSTLPLILCS